MTPVIEIEDLVRCVSENLSKSPRRLVFILPKLRPSPLPDSRVGQSRRPNAFKWPRRILETLTYFNFHVTKRMVVLV